MHVEGSSGQQVARRLSVKAEWSEGWSSFHCFRRSEGWRRSEGSDMFNTTAYGQRQLNIYRQLNIQLTLGVPAHLGPLGLGSGSISADLAKFGLIWTLWSFLNSRNVSF